jgi:hypothetical protein
MCAACVLLPGRGWGKSGRAGETVNRQIVAAYENVQRFAGSFMGRRGLRSHGFATPANYPDLSNQQRRLRGETAVLE